MNNLDVAIIGMSGAFPGASDVREFWRNLEAGRCSLERYTEQELLDAGVDPAHLKSPQYVPVGGRMRDIECFDNEFFGISNHDARLMDPQQRVFLQLAWHAFEDAGFVPGAHPGRVGVRGREPEQLPAHDRVPVRRGRSRPRRPEHSVRQPERLSDDAAVLSARPQGAERQYPDRVLDIARRDPRGMPGSAELPGGRRARGRVLDQRAEHARLPLQPGQFLLAGRPGARVRRTGGGHGVQQRRRARRAQAPGRCAARRRSDLRGAEGERDQQRRLRQGRLRGAERVRAERGDPRRAARVRDPPRADPVCRDARHGHVARRSDRDRRAHRRTRASGGAARPRGTRRARSVR